MSVSQYFNPWDFGVCMGQEGERAKEKDQKGTGRMGVQTAKQHTFQEEGTKWLGNISYTGAPQILGKNGQKFGEGEFGVGETSHWLLPGSHVLCHTDPISQEVRYMGTFETQAGKSQGGGQGGGGGGDDKTYNAVGQADKQGKRKAIQSYKPPQQVAITDYASGEG